MKGKKNHLKIKSIFVFLFLLQLILTDGTCQLNRVSFDHVTVEDGLSQSTIFCFAQDSKGYIWIGSRDGLNRFDSREIKVYKQVPNDPASLSNNVVNALLYDSRNRLWVGTYHGLNLYQPKKNNFQHFASGEKNDSSLTNDNVNCIFEDQDKNIWVGTREGLNLIISIKPLKIIHFYHGNNSGTSLTDNYVRSIYQDKTGEIWIGTLNGISRMKNVGNNKYLFTNYFHDELNLNSLSDNWINVVTEGDNETIWIGTEKGGLNIFERKTNAFINHSNYTKFDQYLNIFKSVDDAVRVISKDKDEHLWLGTLSGLYNYNPFSRNIRKYSSSPDNPSSLSDNSIRSIFIDRDGSFWIGTYYGGVNFYSPISKQFDHFKQFGKNSPLRFKMASALFEDYHHNLWLSIDGGGIIFWDKKNNSFEYYRHKASDPYTLSHNNVKCIYPDGTKGLWIGTFNGLNYFSFATKKFTRYYYDGNNSIPNDRVYDIKRDVNGDLWIATNGGGLCKFNERENKFETFHSVLNDTTTINSDFLTCLYIDSNDLLWTGSSIGLNVRLKNGMFHRFVNSKGGGESIDGKFILFVYEDKQKHIWVGTRGNGLYLFNKQNWDYTIFTTNEGLPGNNIYGMLEDQRGYLWLSTDNGISRFDYQKREFKNYQKSDGIICKEFNYNSYLKDASGYMYFGGYNGIVIFHPDSIETNKSVPPLVFTKLKLFNNELKIDDDRKEFTFRYNQNVFSIEFAILNYINSAKNQYAYMLQGFETNWNYVSKPVATYMNMPPGRYTFLAKGANNDGIWNDNPITIHIRILPPPWKTWWAYLSYALILCLALAGFVYFTRMRLRLEQNLYLGQLENKKQDELYQAKLRFFTNVSHEIRTPLTLIIGPVESLIDKLRHDIDIQKQLQIIGANSKRLLRLINQLLDFRKIETGNVKLKVAEGNFVKFVNEIILAFNEYVRLKKVNLTFRCSQPVIKLWYDRDELEKVLFNLLSNAFKFTPENGIICITLGIHDEQHVILTVEDSGTGIPAEHIDKIFDRFYQVENSGLADYGFGIGLSLSKGIIDLHKGKIKVESIESSENKPGKTVFTIILPMGKDHFNTDEIVDDYKTSEQIESYINLEKDEIGQLKTIIGETPLEGHNEKQYSLLIVEDNPDIRAYLAGNLDNNYSIIEAPDGEKGWELASETLPDLIISDVVMPVMDGLELTNRIKTDERTSHIPVILLTARNTLVNQLEGLETGADEYVTKPFNINVLELRVKNLLAARDKMRAKFSRIITLEPTNTPISSPEEKFLKRLLEIIDKNIALPEFSVPMLVDELGMSRPVLFRKLKALTDMSVIDLIRTTRLKKAAMLLKQKVMTISEVSYAVGFTDSKYFSKAFRQQFGKSPSEFMAEDTPFQ